MNRPYDIEACRELMSDLRASIQRAGMICSGLENEAGSYEDEVHSLAGHISHTLFTLNESVNQLSKIFTLKYSFETQLETDGYDSEEAMQRDLQLKTGAVFRNDGGGSWTVSADSLHTIFVALMRVNGNDTENALERIRDEVNVNK